MGQFARGASQLVATSHAFYSTWQRILALSHPVAKLLCRGAPLPHIPVHCRISSLGICHLDVIARTSWSKFSPWGGVRPDCSKSSYNVSGNAPGSFMTRHQNDLMPVLKHLRDRCARGWMSEVGIFVYYVMHASPVRVGDLKKNAGWISSFGRHGEALFLCLPVALASTTAAAATETEASYSDGNRLFSVSNASSWLGDCDASERMRAAAAGFLLTRHARNGPHPRLPGVHP